MRCRLRSIVALCCLLAVVVPAFAADTAVSVTIQDLRAHPQEYDGKLIQVKGTIEQYREKTSRKGNAYTVFRLASSDGKAWVSVFAFNSQGRHDGESVRVRGVFQEVRQVGRYTFHNEIDASEPNGSIQ